MSDITISGSLILNGHMACDGDVNITSSGEVIPIPVPELSKSFYTYDINQYITANGQGRTIQTTTGDINVDGSINGNARGFLSDQGPGANSTLLNNFGLPIPGYGATHAGRGAKPDFIEQEIQQIYEEFYITSDEFDAHELILTAYPTDPDNIMVNIVGGTSLELGVDFRVDGPRIEWSYMKLEPLIAQGDIMRVSYVGDLTPRAPQSKTPYGSYEAPTSLGSGSGFRHDPRFCFGVETRGGGAIKLVARSGHVTIDGAINMNGQDGINAGGAAGGSIWVIGFRVLGSGQMHADGGTTSYLEGSGGGGGYISVWHEKSLFYTGTMTVLGKEGSDDGKTFVKEFEPIVEDKFTGTILNHKWWEIVDPPVEIDNEIYMDTSAGDTRTPVLESKFDITGKNIIADMDYIPRGAEPNFYSAVFQLYVDDLNWVGLARKNGYIFGVQSEDGFVGQTGVPFPNVPTTFRVIKTDSTFTYQYYDATSTPQTFLIDTIPAFSNSTFKARVSMESPELADSSFMTEYFKLTAGDIANKNVTLSYTPSDSSDVAFNVISGTSQMLVEDFIVEGREISWDKTKLEEDLEPFKLMVTEYFTVTAANVLFKELFLSATPLYPAEVVVNPIMGTPQYVGLDFYVENNIFKWDGRGLDGVLSLGDEIRIMYVTVPFEVNWLEDYLAEDDQVRAIYAIDGTNADTSAAFDHFRLYEGIPFGTETTEPILYVDPVYGSDASSGQQLDPLQNLFVATKWSKKGGTVVLYDGTHGPTDVQRKDLTLRGAEGVKPLITSANSQDTTGSGWETNALSFWSCQGVVKNIKIRGSEKGIITENSPRFDIRDMDIADASTAISVIKSDPVIMRNKISRAQVAIDCTASNHCYIGSNILYADETAIRFTDTTTSTVQSNTIDDCTVAVVLEEDSFAVVASNSITNNGTGIYTSADSSSFSYGNNFYGTTPYGGKAPDVISDNSSADPSYVDQTGRDYHLNSDSSNIGVGFDTYDQYFMDFDGVNRSLVPPTDIGGLEFVNRDHSGDYYVAGAGDDGVNNGGRFSPFRTLDRAMQVADSTVHIDGGHYDSYYLKLKSENIDLNIMTVIYPQGTNFFTYVNLSAADVNNKRLVLPGFSFLDDVDSENVAVNVVCGGSQIYGVDYEIVDGYLVWEGLGWDGEVSVGDTLRIMFVGSLGFNSLETFTMQPHFSNIDLGNTVFVSPNGSDQTSLGVPGENTGGDGSPDRPYRTVEWALQNSTAGDHLIVMAGEYPLFNGLEDRVIVPGLDRAAIVDKEPKRYLEDLFAPIDLRNWNHNDFDRTNWELDFTGDSSANINGGFLRMSYDGTNTTSADSDFLFSGDFEVTTQLRNGIDPMSFSVSDSSTTIFFSYEEGDYTTGASDNGLMQSCWGHLDIVPPQRDMFIVEHIGVTANHVRNAEVPLSFLPEPDCSNFALNIVGGVAQTLGEDFIVKDSKINWRGRELDGEIIPGDVLRIVYQDRELSNPVLVKFTKKDDRITVKAYDYTRWHTLLRKDIHVQGDGTWASSYYMDTAADLSHDYIYGKGYASRYSAVAEEFYNTDADKEYLLKTERKPLVFYEDRT